MLQLLGVSKPMSKENIKAINWHGYEFSVFNNYELTTLTPIEVGKSFASNLLLGVQAPTQVIRCNGSLIPISELKIDETEIKVVDEFTAKVFCAHTALGFVRKYGFTRKNNFGSNKLLEQSVEEIVGLATHMRRCLTQIRNEKVALKLSGVSFDPSNEMVIGTFYRYANNKIKVTSQKTNSKLHNVSLRTKIFSRMMHSSLESYMWSQIHQEVLNVTEVTLVCFSCWNPFISDIKDKRYTANYCLECRNKKRDQKHKQHLKTGVQNGYY